MAGSSNDNDKLTLDEMWALQQRFNGPIPAQYTEDQDLRAVRLQRGALAVAERQLAASLIAAEYAEDEYAYYAAEAQTALIRQQMKNYTLMRDRAVRDAAEALARANALRAELDRAPHPISAIAELAARGEAHVPDKRQLRLAV